jgi:hypothetical protein
MAWYVLCSSAMLVGSVCPSSPQRSKMDAHAASSPRRKVGEARDSTRWCGGESSNC